MICDLAEKQRKKGAQWREEERRKDSGDDGWIREGEFQSPFIFQTESQFRFSNGKTGEGEREKRDIEVAE